MEANKIAMSTAVLQVLSNFEGDSFDRLYSIFSEHLDKESRKELDDYRKGERLPSLSSDIIAKKIFDANEHKERLEYLLRNVINDQNIEVNATTQQEGYIRSTSSKKIIMDLPVTLEDGRFVDVGFQQAAQDFILQRGDIYSADMLLIQYSKEEGKKKNDVNYQNTKGVVLICFMKKSPTFFKKCKNDRYIHRFSTWTSDSGLEYNPLSTIIYVQLDKCFDQFKKDVNGEEDDTLQLLLSMMYDINDIKVNAKAKESDITKGIVSEVTELIQKKEVQKMLLAEKYAEADINSYAYSARLEGEAEGEAKGKAKGKAEGQSLLFSAIQKVRAGETMDNLLSQGFDEETIKFALAVDETKV